MSTARGERDKIVMMALTILDSVMDSMTADDRVRVAHAFANKYANQMSGEGAPHLSTREWQTLRLLSLGETTDSIARRMNVGERTIGTYIGNLLQKLNARNRTHIVTEAFRRGML